MGVAKSRSHRASLGPGELIGHTERIAAFAFCPHREHGALCASGSDDGSVRLWDAAGLVLRGEHGLHQVGAGPWAFVMSDAAHRMGGA